MRNNQGFTLIELMIAIIVLGFMFTLALPFYHRYTEQAYLAKAHTALMNIHTQLKIKLAQNPLLDIPTELEHIHHYGIDQTITEKYEFHVEMYQQDSRAYRISAQPKEQTSYSTSIWVDSLGNTKKCLKINLSDCEPI
ncbi:type IV pilin protein [Neisseria sp. CCUG17229]|uniref:type IV pilin protein n=1 Tax=Neisseria sp. CCUG17229 TaxID=3392036 RepID=UPI003A0FF1E4